MTDYVNVELFSQWLVDYGSISLFILLALGIIALPVPEETLMVIAGFLVSKGLLNFPFTWVAAFLGSIFGISVSYLIGKKVGYFVLHEYGKWVGITEKKLQKAHNWFEKYGTWSLFIGYFIPGVRHFTGVIAGATELEYSRFALFAFTGAFFWVTTFLSVGYFFGDYWVLILEKIEDSFLYILIAAAAALISYIIYKISLQINK